MSDPLKLMPFNSTVAQVPLLLLLASEFDFTAMTFFSGSFGDGLAAIANE